MKVNFDATMKDLDGKDIPVSDTDGRPITLKLVAIRALTTPIREDENLKGEEAFKRLELARKVNAGGEVELDPADAVLIRDRAPKVWTMVIAGQAYEMLKG